MTTIGLNALRGMSVAVQGVRLVNLIKRTLDADDHIHNKGQAVHRF